MKINTREVLKSNGGYTLMEDIIAIGICGFTLVTILGLYSIGMDMKQTSENIFDQSMEVNTIRSAIEENWNGEEDLIRVVKEVLKTHPRYSVGKAIEKKKNLVEVELVFKNVKRANKSYFMAFYDGMSNED